MDQIRLSDSDLMTNKNPHMPICVLIETSDEVMADAGNIRNIERGLEQLIGSISASVALKSLADICVICFGNTPRLTRQFGTLLDGEKVVPETIGGKPDLRSALALMIKQYRIRLNDYDRNHVMRYEPMFFIISSDSPAPDADAEVSQICHWSRTNQVSVIPVAVGKTHGNTLCGLTPEGIVYHMNALNYEKLFGAVQKSIEEISKSSLSAVENLKLKSIEWDQFKRK